MSNKDWTIVEILDWATKFLKGKRLDAEILLSHSLQIKRFDLYLKFDKILNLDDLKNFKELITKRNQGLPVAYILGQKEFMSLDFIVNENVLIPRPDTEILVEEALKIIENGFTIVDTFTGSGNIPISIAKHAKKDVFVYGIDVNLNTLHCAHQNNLKHKTQNIVRFLHGSILEPLDVLGLSNKVDVITANPPYIKTQDLKNLQIEVKFEPKLALDGGIDGLIFYRNLINESLEYLKINGFLFLEIDPELAEPIIKILENHGFSEFKIVKDLQKLDRVLIARRIK